MITHDPQQNNADLIELLGGLISHGEDEVVEFKEAGNSYSKGDIGKYFSALSNEANLRNVQYGWFILGVNNKTHEIVGTDYRDTAGLLTLKHEISQNTTGGISYADIFEVYPEVSGTQKRVVMMKIPAAPTGIPTGWNDHYYGRAGESLTALSTSEYDTIRSQKRQDWTREVIPNSTIDSLDPEAIAIAREKYKEKKDDPTISEMVDHMSDEEFLQKSRLMLGKELTNAAVVLLGKAEQDILLSPIPQIQWRLFGENGRQKDNEIFCIPFITATERVFEKTRNLNYRYMPNQMTLFPSETRQYDPWMLRELLHNCIAHQSYEAGSRIYVDEFEDDRIVVTNAGTFLPGSIQEVLKPGFTSPYYRNQVLANAMVDYNMIETSSLGIPKIYEIQKKKYFPMPDYQIAKPNKVVVTVYGKVLDENYTWILFERPDMDLETVFLLDRVQKKLPIEKIEITRLRKLKLIEGNASHLFVSSGIAEIINEQAQYIKNKGFNDAYYRDMIIEYLKKFQTGTKSDFVDLLWDKLPESLTDEQKDAKLRNLLTALKTAGIIKRDSDNRRTANWVLTE